MTPLMLAAKDNRTGLLDRLIDLGSDVGARNNVSPFRILLQQIGISSLTYVINSPIVSDFMAGTRLMKSVNIRGNWAING